MQSYAKVQFIISNLLKPIVRRRTSIFIDAEPLCMTDFNCPLQLQKTPDGEEADLPRQADLVEISLQLGRIILAQL